MSGERWRLCDAECHTAFGPVAYFFPNQTAMPLFLTGDELGNIKSLQVTTPDVPSELKLLHATSSVAVSALSIAPTASTSKSVAAAYADGSVTAFTLQDNQLQISEQWKETRFKPDQNFVGLQVTDR